MQSTAIRFQFIDLLRGLAALFRGAYSFNGGFSRRPEFGGAHHHGRACRNCRFPPSIGEIISYFNFASIGVAFFLVSGFFPTYWVAFGSGVTALFVSGAFWSKPVTYDFTDSSWRNLPAFDMRPNGVRVATNRSEDATSVAQFDNRQPVWGLHKVL